MSLRNGRNFATAILCLAACQQPAPLAPTHAAELKAAAWQALFARIFEHPWDGICVSPDWICVDPYLDADLESWLLSSIQSQRPWWSEESLADLFHGPLNDEELSSHLSEALGFAWCDHPVHGDGANNYSFTRMGFSRYVNEAVIYVQYYGGPLGFDGSLYVLQRDLQGWKVVDIIHMFVS